MYTYTDMSVGQKRTFHQREKMDDISTNKIMCVEKEQDTTSLNDRSVETISLPKFLLLKDEKNRQQQLTELTKHSFSSPPVTPIAQAYLQSCRSNFLLSIQQIQQFIAEHNIQDHTIICAINFMKKQVELSESIHDLVKCGYIYTMMCTFIFQNKGDLIFPQNYMQLFFKENIRITDIVNIFDLIKNDKFIKKDIITTILDDKKNNSLHLLLTGFHLINDKNCFLFPIINNELQMEHFIAVLPYNIHLIPINTHMHVFSIFENTSLNPHSCFLYAFIRTTTIFHTINEKHLQDFAVLSRIFDYICKTPLTFTAFSQKNIELIIFSIMSEYTGSLSDFFGEHEFNPDFYIFFDAENNKLKNISNIMAFIYLGGLINHCKNYKFDIMNATLEQFQKMIMDFNSTHDYFLTLENQANYIYRLQNFIINPKYKLLFQEIIKTKYQVLNVSDDDLGGLPYSSLCNLYFVKKANQEKMLELITYMEQTKDVPTLECCLKFIT